MAPVAYFVVRQAKVAEARGGGIGGMVGWC